MQSKLEIIFSDWLDALRRRDIDLVASRLAPDVIHEGIRPELCCRGRDVVLGRLRKQAAHPPEVTALELVEVGDKVVLSVRAATVGVATDVDSGEARGQATIVFTFHGSLIVGMHDFVRREDALAAAGAPSPHVWE